MKRLRALVLATLVATTVLVGAAAPSDALVAVTVGTSYTDGRPLCGFALPPANAHPAADDGVIKVATFNVLHSETDEGDRSLGARLPLVADAIAQSGADIVGAQELTYNFAFNARAEYPQKHGVVAQRLAAAIAARHGERWHWCFSRSNPHVPLTPDTQLGGGQPLDDLAARMGNIPEAGSFSEGIAIFSRYRIGQAKFRRMLPRSYEAAACLGVDPFCPLDATFDSRQVLYGRVHSPFGGIDMFTTHIAHGLTSLSTLTKQLQMRQAIAVVREWSHPDRVPDFLVGDMNSAPTSAALRTAAAGGFIDTYKTGGGIECTTRGGPGCSGGPRSGEESYTKGPTRGMSERIDYVLARAGRGCLLRVPATRMLGNAPTKQANGRYLWPSDHDGFVSTITCR